ncbi:MAG: hypothetical protein HOG49_15085 [Candidatus Scalindua sp.]|jgi:predicted amidophosphoribosyltransferase|nr:hypothetical protein [Candidatus Scalindua sp.]
MHNMSSNFQFLSGAYFLAYYIPRSHESTDKVSSYILHFKKNKEPITSKWIALSSKEVCDHILNIDLIVRVLSSTELIASGNTSLDRLGATLAKYTGSKYEKQLLKKTRNTRSLKYLSRAERLEEIEGSYEFQRSQIVPHNNPRILLIDDIVTTGSTIREVNRAIKSILPNCRLYFFTIGKTYDSWASYDQSNEMIRRELTKSLERIESCIQPEPNNVLSDEEYIAYIEYMSSDGISNSLIKPPGPNLVKIEGGGWEPALGYNWKNDDGDDFTVILKQPPHPNLVMCENGRWKPAEGYVWENKDDPNNLKVITNGQE